MIQFSQGEGMHFRLRDIREIKKWLEAVAEKRGFTIAELGVIWMTDPGLREMNQTYLQHDYETDIITFDYSQGESPLSGELFISIDRVKDNAKTYGVLFRDELHRVLVHGLLHLSGLKDDTDKARAGMRKAEDEALAMRHWLKA